MESYLKTKKVAIIGAGPAGMAAALQLKHFGISPILLEQNDQGSLLKNAWGVENHLGSYPGMSGIELLKSFQRHLTKNKIKKISANVEALSYSFKTKLFRIKTDNKVYRVNYVIVASGTKPRILRQKLPLATNAQIFRDVYPLLKKRKKTILIIGGGDAAFDNAINLSRHNKVIVCNRAKRSNALPILIKKAQAQPNITCFSEYKLRSVASIKLQKKLGVIFANCGKDAYIEADYLLIAIGRLPQKDFYSDELCMTEKMLIKEGRLFLAGDVKNDICRQVSIAIGDGVLAAMKIFHKLGKYESKDY